MDQNNYEILLSWINDTVNLLVKVDKLMTQLIYLTGGWMDDSYFNNWSGLMDDC